MKPATYLTTSWDDGHPLDLRVAELLVKYGLRGTFYVPRTNGTETMSAAQVRELSRAFEVGAHTAHHTILTSVTERQAWQEIVDARVWLEDTTSQPCPMFCPPSGKFTRRHLGLIRQAGYRGVRSVELLSIAPPRPRAGLLVQPTSVQAHPHGLATFARNLLKRAACKNLWLFLAHGRSTDWVRLTRSLAEHAVRGGGIFHLWGHSWELEATSQWRRLEEVLRFLSQLTGRAPARTNGQVCQEFLAVERLPTVEESALSGRRKQ
jgi:peptidoglycan/xylan/chitin deacetylase (PgdA/CDA1 family)